MGIGTQINRLKVFICLNPEAEDSVCSDQVDLIKKQDCGEDEIGECRTRINKD